MFPSFINCRLPPEFAQFFFFFSGWGIAQLVQRLTERPGAILTRARVPCAARDFSPRADFQCRLSYGVRTAPVCNQSHASTSVCTLTIPNSGSHTTVWIRENTHTLIGMGSAALAAVVPYPGKATRISREGQ